MLGGRLIESGGHEAFDSISFHRCQQASDSIGCSDGSAGCRDRAAKSESDSVSIVLSPKKAGEFPHAVFGVGADGLFVVLDPGSVCCTDLDQLGSSLL